MTEFEHHMLSSCYGMTVGFVIGMWVIIIKEAIHNFREKRRKKKENNDQ